MRVDIIIPIYNALEYLKQCVKSIYMYTDEEIFNLILIDDCSPDNGVQEFLKEVVANHKNIIVYTNKKNIGFVGTVNRGMSNSSNDVILLNSDTEVTPFWLEKMKEAAYSGKAVATVTTLTNSGTICSLPNFCEDNEIPDNFNSYLDFAEMIHNYTIKKYAEAPTGVGFCMYIKRSVLNIVGLFDQEKFGKGYGEENDFCCRCVEHGFKNIIDDATFVYHKGSMSFNEAKNEYVQNNLKILSDLYPYYNKEVASFCEKNPLFQIHQVVKLQIKLRNSKRNMLYVLHNDIDIGRNHPCGGTEMHVKDLVDNLKDEYNIFVLSSHKDSLFLDIFFDEEVKMLEFKLNESIKVNDFYRNDYRETVEAIIKYFQIGLVHIHHFKGNTFDVVEIANELNIPTLYTIHDFHSICPNINLLYDDDIHCRYLKSKSNCDKCIKKKFEFNCISKPWRDSFYNNIRKLTKIITPSESAKRIFIKYYEDFGYDMSKIDIDVVEHGEFERGEIPLAKSNIQNERFKIVVFGGIIKHKGSQILLQLLKKSENVEWHIFGNIYEDEILCFNKENIHINGKYDKTDILKILVDLAPDITLNLPIWPETFSYVLTESFASGIPVLGTNLGALSERIIENENGWHVSFPLDISEIEKKITYLNNHRDEIVKVKQKLKKYQNKFLIDMKEDYDILYKEFYSTTNFKTSVFQNRIIANSLDKKDVFKSTSNINENEYQRLLGIEQEYFSLLTHVNQIHSSNTWRRLQWINNHIDRLKGIIKKIVSIFK